MWSLFCRHHRQKTEAFGTLGTESTALAPRATLKSAPDGTWPATGAGRGRWYGRCFCPGETEFFITENLLPTSRTVLLATLLAAAALAPRARAAGTAAPAAGQDATLAERAKLQAQLDRVNAEIDALKQRPLSIRDDYRLRSRMADAEALARRLNDIEARLGPASRSAPGLAPPEVHISASDDRVERDAKADILADQARRLSSEANVLEGRLTALRSRNELKRRAGQLERDPFAPLEQVKSRVAVNGTGSSHTVLTGAPDTTKGTSPGRTGTPVTGGNGTDSPGGATTGSAMPSGTSGAPTVVPSLMPAASPVSQSADTGAGSLASQLRGVLDPASLEEVRRLETPGAGPANLQVMERAVKALRGRAAELAAASAALRAPAP